MKQLDDSHQRMLQKIAVNIQAELSSKLVDNRIVKIEELKVMKTDTFGYYVDIFYFKRIEGRGTVEIWLDMWPNIDRPVLSICFWSSNIERIKKVIEKLPGGFLNYRRIKIKPFHHGIVLEQPLRKNQFEKFLIEPYYTNWLSYYFLDEIRTTRNVSTLFLKKINNKTEELIRAIVPALEIKTNIRVDVNKEVSDLKDLSKLIGNKSADTINEIKELERKMSKQRPEIKQKISTFIERGVIATKVKKIMGFKCLVCEALKLNPLGFRKNNAEHYIETHHIEPVSTLNKGTLGLSNLITVCANHHRQLHYGNVEIIKQTRSSLKLSIDGKTINIKKISVKKLAEEF